MATTFADVRGNKEGSVSLKGVPIRILVGESEESFYIHESLLSATSEFFRAAMKKEWMEGQDRTIKLPIDDSETFHTYMQWMYTSKIFSKTTEKWGQQNYSCLGRLYGLGEKLMDQTFQNRIIDAYVAAIRQIKPGNAEARFPTVHDTNAVYKSMPAGSPLRRLIVAIHVKYASAGSVKDRPALCNEFVRDLAIALLEDRPKPPVGKPEYEQLGAGIPRSYYH